MSRISHCRGFGVQSPSAYRFIRYVVNEHFPYYAYDSLRLAFPGESPDKHRLHRLYFRIANFAQASRCIDYSCCGAMFERYVKAACSKTEVVRVEPGICADSLDGLLRPLAPLRFVRIAASEGCVGFAEKVLECSSTDTLVVVERIKSDASMREAWRKIMSDSRVSVSFDLYYCGIAFFDTGRFKRNYVVNF